MAERRKKFFINRSLQFRYMGFFGLTFVAVSVVIVVNLYFGIWGGVLDAFSDEKMQNDLLTASRLTQYEQARMPGTADSTSVLAFFKQTEKLSQRQQEVFKEILVRTNRKLFPKLWILLFLIGWGSIYLSHKIAGPLHRFHSSMHDLSRGDTTTRVHLRRSDEARFVADEMNQTLEHLDSTFSKFKALLNENDSDLETLKSRLNEELSKIKTSNGD